MATIESLKQALREKFKEKSPTPGQPLSDIQYSNSFATLVKGSERIYQEFIVPKLTELIASFDSNISLLEIGPGPTSVLRFLPRELRRNIKKYTAFEPNNLFATRLEDWLCHTSGGELPLPCLEGGHIVYRTRFPNSNPEASIEKDVEKFDVIHFCHSLYGISPKRACIEKSLQMLVDGPRAGIVVIFHCDTLRLDGLVSQRRASFPTGTVEVPDEDAALNSFSSFIAGFVAENAEIQRALQVEWRAVCRAMGRSSQAGCLSFTSPQAMITFTKSAVTLPTLAAQVPLLSGNKVIKNREARLHRPAAVVSPATIADVQQCVQWAIEQRVSLTVIGGGHSSHCVWPETVSIDMAAFNQVHVYRTESELLPGPCVVAGAGCKTEDIVRSTMTVGLTVPLGSRPSVGAGLWLQGGIGHLARLHGLACDAIVGAVMVSVKTGRVLVVGSVPSEQCPRNAVRPKNEDDLLWALRGAGTNIGIVIYVTFQAYPAPTYSVRNWVIAINNPLEAQHRLARLGHLASQLPRHCSADAYLHWDSDRLQLGVTVFEACAAKPPAEPLHPMLQRLVADLGPVDSVQGVDCVGLFDCELYISRMHGGHGGGRTSSFKRCLFLKDIGRTSIADILVSAIETRPSPLCYLHLLHGGGAVGDVALHATAFGSRDWEYACVVTGVWPRTHDQTHISERAIEWVYEVVRNLLPVSDGVYGADLGPDPRDARLAAKAFKSNGPRLAGIKRGCDPYGVLAYACPVPKMPTLIILVTGASGSGKDYCASIWASHITTKTNQALTARVASISEATKRAYAAATGCDMDRLLWDRSYKEQHRPALTAFFQQQVTCRPQLPEEHFLDVVGASVDANVLLITGMRDEAPVATFSKLVPDIRLIEVKVTASESTRRARRGTCSAGDTHGNDGQSGTSNTTSTATVLDYRPDLTFHNDAPGSEVAEQFAERCLFPYCDRSLQQLANMVRLVPDFPCPGVDFRHVLNIAQHRGGLELCASLLQSHFSGDWSKVDAIACCQAAGYVFAPALSVRVNVPLALIREGGKLPPPLTSVFKPRSHISSLGSSHASRNLMEMEEGLVSGGSSVVVVDDVLASGHTLCAVLQLLHQAGISAEKLHVMVVAEFPAHGGRDFLRRQGFGRVTIQSLLVLGGL
ncbi:hypothetical protein BDW67DRAFT_184104 [Aspergillus spinulosporus]